ncbi:unnamed protein product [Amoebophrya sp. A25]|nr:unnamed protein product [Amoebophrya sp. A25]|eukprot:GSA25T00015272001.1
MFSGAVELAVKVPKSGKLLWSNVKSVTPGAGSSMRMTKADAGSPQANVDTSALVGLKAQLAEEKKISSKARDAAEAAENHAKQLADQYAKEKAETAEVVRHLQAQVASAKSTSAAAPTPAATVPQGQAALIGIKNMRLLEKDPDMNVVAAVWNWSWILGKMGEAVSALGPQAPPQAMEYVQQMQAQAGQVGGVPTRENYEMFVANAYQVATALAGILDGGAKVPLHTAYLAAPLRAELCISASCL